MRKTKSIRPKTKEEIQRANLRKSLSKLKETVAEREELWLEMFVNLLPLCVKEGEVLLEVNIDVASRMADHFLDAYETRWCTSVEMLDRNR